MFMASVAAATPVDSPAINGTDVNREVFVNPSTQQAKLTVTGVVEDQFGPVAGANIVEKGTTNGTITDMEGKFTLEVSPNGKGSNKSCDRGVALQGENDRKISRPGL